MTDPIKVVEGNPPSGGEQPATQVAQPQNEKVTPVNPQPSTDARIKEIETKLETVTRQYAGSSAEAIRLKEENEKLKKDLEEAKRQPSVSSDKVFQQLVEEKGLQAAIDHLVNEKLTSIESKVDGLYTKESKKIYEDFKASHKGLVNVEVLARFEKEFNSLKGVYSDMNEALEKAYLLAGGKEAETAPAPTQPVVQKQDDENVVKSVVGGDSDKRLMPAAPTVSEIQQRINDLEVQAAILDRAGRDATMLYVEVDQLKSQLAGKV